MNRKVSDGGKNLLINTIQSVEHQNRRNEENKAAKPSHHRPGSSHHLRHKSRSEDREIERSKKRKRSESSPSVDRLDSKYDCAKHWIKRLYKLKASDGDRWNHDGYKELYPQYFASSSSESSSESDDEKPQSSYRETNKETCKIKKKRSKDRRKHKKKKKHKKLLF